MEIVKSLVSFWGSLYVGMVFFLLSLMRLVFMDLDQLRRTSKTELFLFPFGIGAITSGSLMIVAGLLG